ncbi:MAG: nucleotide pyrophosphohydrolase [Deltaproteobacteria bacterium]|nr:nucleotide pyrophosphohydrolase [Deltaproteobacteria bacterium]
MGDETTTLAELKTRTAEFVHERDWEQFHTPKNLSMSLAIEAAELMEHFQWVSVEESASLTSEELQKVGEELADIVLYALSMANSLGLDLSKTVLDKMAKNARKYPSEKVRGKSHKYTYYKKADDEAEN